MKNDATGPHAAAADTIPGAAVGVPYLGTIQVGAYPSQTFRHRCLIRAVDDTDASIALGKLLEDWVHAARSEGDVVFHDGQAWSLDNGSVRMFNSGAKRISEDVYAELYHLFSGDGEHDTLLVTDAAYSRGPKPAPVPAQPTATAAMTVLHDAELVEAAAADGMTPTARAQAAVEDADTEVLAHALQTRLQPFSLEVAGLHPNASSLLIDLRPAVDGAPGKTEMALSIAVEINEGLPCVRVYRADDEAPAVSLFASADGRLTVRQDEGWEKVSVVDSQWMPGAPEIPELNPAEEIADRPRERG